jgi:nucleoid-associated protein YgaU
MGRLRPEAWSGESPDEVAPAFEFAGLGMADQAGVDTAARSLLRVAQRVDAERHGPPAALAVITGWGYAYRRPDGVGVIPIGALAP